MPPYKPLGQFIAGLGTIASNIAGRDIRLGSGGSSLGANIAGESQPYFSTTQNLQYSNQGINPYADVPAGYQGKSAAQIAAEQANQQQQQQQQQQNNLPPVDTNRFTTEYGKQFNVGDIKDGMRWDGVRWTQEGGGGGGQSAEQQAITARENQVRSDIESGYSGYFSELDRLMGNIPGQEAGQKQTVESNYAQNISDLGSQQQQSMADLNTSRRKSGEQQVKSLQDISENIRNLFQTGNVMLGTRGAGDSSAANQYSYAVAKLGSKERGNVMSQSRAIESDIADRESRLNNIVTQETGKYKTERDNKIVEVAQWFQDQQNQLMQAKASGQLQKGQSLAQLSTQLLQNAQNELIRQDTNYKNRQNALLSWATSNSQNIGQLKTNLAGIGQYNVPANQAQNISGAPTFDAQGNMTTSFAGGGGYREPTKDKLPQNFSQFGGMIGSQLPLGNTLDNLLR